MDIVIKLVRENFKNAIRARKWYNDLFGYYWERAMVKYELPFERPYEAK
jgi:hypothetical protein